MKYCADVYDKFSGKNRLSIHVSMFPFINVHVPNKKWVDPNVRIHSDMEQWHAGNTIFLLYLFVLSFTTIETSISVRAVGALTFISQPVFKGHGAETSPHTFISMYYMAQLRLGGEDNHVSVSTSVLYWNRHGLIIQLTTQYTRIVALKKI